VALASLLEMTPVSTVGKFLGTQDDGDGVVTLYFASESSGYPGWRWTVSISHQDGQDPSVLETELTPGDGALLAPDWVPWSDRLADYKAAQEPGSEDESEDSDDSSDGDDDDDDESDDEEVESEDDDDDLGSDILHGGDVDGVDIDEVDVSGDESDESDDDSDPDDDENDFDEDESDDEDEREKNY
jgi:hypothetical protein